MVDSWLETKFLSAEICFLCASAWLSLVPNCSFVFSDSLILRVKLGLLMFELLLEAIDAQSLAQDYSFKLRSLTFLRVQTVSFVFELFLEVIGAKLMADNLTFELRDFLIFGTETIIFVLELVVARGQCPGLLGSQIVHSFELLPQMTDLLISQSVIIICGLGLVL
jgi:hypothetical protein